MVETTYTKDGVELGGGDFGGNFHSDNFKDEVNAEGGITPNLVRLDRVGDTVDIVFDAALSAGEQTTLSTLVSNHNSTSPSSYDNTFSVPLKENSFSYNSYYLLGAFTYEGSVVVGAIEKITCSGYKDSGLTNFTIKVYDKTNELVLSENTFTNTSSSILNLTPISNVPTTSSKIEVLVKVSGGASTDKAYLENITFYL